MTPRRVLGALLLPLMLVATASCGSEEEPTTGAGDSAGFNEADVEFASSMIPHHAQALVMVDLTVDKAVDPELAALAEQIRAAQTPEIETMTDWLTRWDEPVPETMRDHANAHGDTHMDDSEMPGMMSAEDLHDLERLSGAGFEEKWLDLMIEHHEGAIEMAGTEVDAGEFPDAVALAEDIVDGQTAEIEQMEKLKESLAS